MQLFLEDKPIILRLLEDTYYSQIIPRIICQSLLSILHYTSYLRLAGKLYQLLLKQNCQKSAIYTCPSNNKRNFNTCLD